MHNEYFHSQVANYVPRKYDFVEKALFRYVHAFENFYHCTKM